MSLAMPTFKGYTRTNSPLHEEVADRICKDFVTASCIFGVCCQISFWFYKIVSKSNACSHGLATEIGAMLCLTFSMDKKLDGELLT